MFEILAFCFFTCRVDFYQYFKHLMQVNTGRINKVNAVHAIRIKKLLDVTVSCKSQEKTKPGEIAKGTSKVRN